MLNKAVFEALDKTLKDIRSTNEIMGGIPVMLCGDFRQILPVIRSGTRANIINVCISLERSKAPKTDYKYACSSA